MLYPEEKCHVTIKHKLCKRLEAMSLRSYNRVGRKGMRERDLSHIYSIFSSFIFVSLTVSS